MAENHVERRTTLATDNYKFIAALGDLRHKESVYVHFRSTSDPLVLRLLRNDEQADYIRRRYPHLVPSPQPDQPPPSDHSIATVFEYQFYTDPFFVSHYLTFLIEVQTHPRFFYSLTRYPITTYLDPTSSHHV